MPMQVFSIRTPKEKDMDFEYKVEILKKQIDAINSETSDILDATNQAIILYRNLLLELTKPFPSPNSGE